MYGAGVSETALATGLKACGVADKGVVIETKWMPLLRTASNIHKTIDNRLRYLEGYTISNYMVHQPWSFPLLKQKWTPWPTWWKPVR